MVLEWYNRICTFRTKAVSPYRKSRTECMMRTSSQLRSVPLPACGTINVLFGGCHPRKTNCCSRSLRRQGGLTNRNGHFGSIYIYTHICRCMRMGWGQYDQCRWSRSDSNSPLLLACLISHRSHCVVDREICVCVCVYVLFNLCQPVVIDIWGVNVLECVKLWRPQPYEVGTYRTWCQCPY